jgi:hypothetical protein
VLCQLYLQLEGLQAAGAAGRARGAVIELLSCSLLPPWQHSCRADQDRGAGLLDGGAPWRCLHGVQDHLDACR